MIGITAEDGAMGLAGLSKINMVRRVRREVAEWSLANRGFADFRITNVVQMREADVRKVYSHAQSLAQCVQWLARNLPTATRVPATSIFMALRSAFALATASSAAGLPAGLSATENRVMGSPVTSARTAARRTACMEREEPSVQMKKPCLARLFLATSTEQGAMVVTVCTMPESKKAMNSGRQRDGSPKMIRL